MSCLSNNIRQESGITSPSQEDRQSSLQKHLAVHEALGLHEEEDNLLLSIVSDNF